MYASFGDVPTIQTVPDPSPPDGGVVIEVKASGLCRSDWHGWMGHDPDIRLPHVPGHELAGVVVAAGKNVQRWKTGDRVTLPFVCGCGTCPQCESGNHQVCDFQFQPGFTHWGSFAQFVAIDYADVNLVRLPEEMDFVTAASLGCRFVTAFRAIVDRAQVASGQWVAVHGCGGVGVSAIMIAHAMGARVVAIDVTEEKLKFARSVGACETVHAGIVEDVAEAVRDITGGGAHISLDALGSAITSWNSIANLRKRGTHVQVGLLVNEDAKTRWPGDLILARELNVLGSHGMQAHRYDQMLQMVSGGQLDPRRLVGRTIALQECPTALVDLDRFPGVGVTVISEF
jgi:alcohol dehydrogenase